MIAIELFLAVALSAASCDRPGFPRPGVDAQAERATAVRAEEAADWDAALLHYENIYDSTTTTADERDALRKKFAELRPKVEPNQDPRRAGVWKVKAYAFRELDFRWKDAAGKELHAEHCYRDDEIRRIRRGMAGFKDRVWEFSSGNLRIDWDLTVLEKPLTKLDGKSVSPSVPSLEAISTVRRSSRSFYRQQP